jgi:hypothetical protein
MNANGIYGNLGSAPPDMYQPRGAKVLLGNGGGIDFAAGGTLTLSGGTTCSYPLLRQLSKVSGS